MAFTIVTMGIRGIGLETECLARHYGCPLKIMVPQCFARHGHYVKNLSRQTLAQARPWIELAVRVLKRNVINQLHADHIACLFHLVYASTSIVAIASLEDEHTGRGMSGWGIEFCKMLDKPLHVFNVDNDQWFQWKGYRFVATKAPILTETTGIFGIKNVNELPESLFALKRVFKRMLCVLLYGFRG